MRIEIVTFKIGFDENGFLYDTRIDYKSLDYKSEHIYGNIKKFSSNDDTFSLTLNRNNLNEANVNLSKNGINLGNKKILETNGKIRFFIIFNKYEVNKYSISFTELKKSY